MAFFSDWKRFFTRLGVVLFRYIFMTFQRVYWKINGTSERVRESRRPENYNRCGHVLDIVLFYKVNYQQNVSVRDYTLSHNRFESPRYIFDNDHVTLVTINEEYAIFGVAKRKDMLLWRMEYSSFMRFSQQLHCNQLIFVPLNHFHRMAEELGDPKGQLIILFSNGRCGSTLLAQMMQTTDKCISISEPEGLNALSFYYRHRGNTPEMLQLTKDVVRWTCRPYKTITPLAYMLKIRPVYSFSCPLFREVYPNSKCIFMYRNVVKVAQSLYRFGRELTAQGMKGNLGLLIDILPPKSYEYVRDLGKDFSGMFVDEFSQGFLVTAVLCKLYMEFRRKGLELSAVRYEDLVSDKHFAVREILKVCGLPLSLEQDVVRGLDFDSQRNSMVSQKLLAKHKEVPLTPEFERLANEVLKKGNLPIIAKDWLLEGTFTHKE